MAAETGLDDFVERHVDLGHLRCRLLDLHRADPRPVAMWTTQFLRAGYDRTQFGLSWSSQFVEGSLGNKHSVACMEH